MIKAIISIVLSVLITLSLACFPLYLNRNLRMNDQFGEHRAPTQTWLWSEEDSFFSRIITVDAYCYLSELNHHSPDAVASQVWSSTNERIFVRNTNRTKPKAFPTWSVCSRLYECPRTKGIPGIDFWEEHAAGFPFPSLSMFRYGTIKPSLPSPLIDSEINCIYTGISGKNLQVYLLTPGLLASILFWEVILICCWFMLRSCQHYIRFKKGVCRLCGYNLRGDFSAGCPECGWGRSSKHNIKSNTGLV